MKVCKYQRLKQQISYDGINWSDTGLYATGDLIERDSQDCGYVPGYVFTFQNGQDSTSASVPSGSSVVTIGVISTFGGLLTGFTASESLDWLSVTTSLTGITISVSGNTGDTRNGTITLTQSGSNYTCTLSVSQASSIQPQPMSGTYLTLEALEYNTIFHMSDIQYSTDCGLTWIDTGSGTTTPAFRSGDTIILKSDGLHQMGISADRTYKAYGNAMSLIYGDDFVGKTSVPRLAFYYLFSYSNNLTDASGLLLPATTLGDDCYYGMFAGCSLMTAAPALPATTLAVRCYQNMFYECLSLTTAPELPATTLVDSCYRNMFAWCYELRNIKCLATDISASNCTNDWTLNVASSGTFIKNPSMSSWTSGWNGIPNNWTVQNA